jgi:choline kinase
MIRTAVILAAGMGVRLKGIAGDVPKGFIQFHGQSLIERSLSSLHAHGIETVIIVTGHLHTFYDELKHDGPGLITVINEKYAVSGSMYSLFMAKDLLHERKEDFLLLESDLLYEDRAISGLLSCPHENAILISGPTASGDEVYVEADGHRFINMSKKRSDLNHVTGELVGISRISYDMFTQMASTAEQMFAESLKVEYEQCIVQTAQRYPVFIHCIDDLIWTEIDDPDHMRRALAIIAPKLFGQ